MRGSAIGVILRKEWEELFFSPIAYVVIAIYLVITGVFFFYALPFFTYGVVTLRNFFAFAPYLLSFAIAALTMRLYSEERRSGTYEILGTLPYRPLEILLGKYLAVVLLVALMQLFTLSYPLSIALIGKLDTGEIIAGYLGLLLLNLSYTAIGLFCSTLSSNPVASFSITFLVTLLLAMISLTLNYVPDFLVAPLSMISSVTRLGRMTQGVVDFRDLFYFLSLAFIFLLAAWNMATKER